ncbi:MAG: superoxide dismutase [Cu-Zn] SodC2 [Rhodospirillales bacterium]|nr:superoxide dismutase [Cu-Zn] SodC2 [Rhodospirillales bacterium]
MKAIIGAAVLAAAVAFAFAAPASADDVTVKVFKITDKGQTDQVGTIRFSDGPKGIEVRPRLKGLPPGPHGFHIHENRSCDAKPNPQGAMTPGLGAGGHYDPTKTGKHLGHTGEGHIGDLPVLMVAADGGAGGTMAAPRLKVSDIKGRAVVIHAGGDNYSDQPAALGGGGARIACGLI